MTTAMRGDAVYSRDARTVRWGIVSTGNIAGVFTTDLALLPNHRVVAVGSRDLERARAFAAKHGIDRAYGSYQEVADDPEVDVVYVATPHSDHHRTTAYVLRAGKAALTEKAFTVNSAEARDLIELARRHHGFLMEAMWMRCNPLHLKLRELVDDGAIGEPRTLRAELAFTPPYDPTSRLFDPALTGGALLDVGVYPVGLAYHLFGAPDRVHAQAAMVPTGVDGTVSAVLGWSDRGIHATVTGSLISNLPNTAAIGGSEGWIELPRSFHDTHRLVLHRIGAEPETISVELNGVGYTYEAEEVAHGLAAGAIESTKVTHADTLAVMALLDEIREQIGLRYPGEPAESQRQEKHGR